MIQPAWRGDLHAYLGGIIRTADGIAESIGGVSDHVHLLIGLRATHRLADVIRELKAVSSVGAQRLGCGFRMAGRLRRIHGERFPNGKQFANTSMQQAEHHRTRTFREEYLELLRRSGVEFDERYL